MSPVGAIFVPFPLKTGTNLLHPLPLSIVERVNTPKINRVLVAGYRCKVQLDTSQKAVTGNLFFVVY